MKAALPPLVKAADVPRSRAASIALWAITIFLVLLFLVEGGSKLLFDAGTIKNFHKWGYPTWLVFVVGLLEFPGAILILFPRLALLGAALLVADMIGAIVTGLVQGIVPIVLVSAFILALIAVIGWVRRKRFVGWSLLPRPALRATTVEERFSESAQWSNHKEQANG